MQVLPLAEGFRQLYQVRAEVLRLLYQVREEVSRLRYQVRVGQSRLSPMLPTQPYLRVST